MTQNLTRLVTSLIVLVVVIIVINTLLLTSQQPRESEFQVISLKIDDASARLAKALTIQTLAVPQSDIQGLQAFTDFAEFLEQQFPLVHTNLHRFKINQHSLLFEWTGTLPELNPGMMLAHMDVVPVDPGSQDRWQYPAFAGTVADGYIWGRGAVDDKGSLMAMLEATELLLAEGYQPERTLYFGFGHDEEIGGQAGAMEIVRWLKQRDIRLHFVVDEGMLVTDGGIPGIDKPVALIGIAEKGYISLKLSAQAEGGHASMPPQDTAVSLLSSAIDKLTYNQMPASLHGPLSDMFEVLGAEMDFPYNLVFANMDILSPVVKQIFAGNPATNAMLRTTTAPTMFSAGVKDNVLPTDAEAIVNFRIHPNDSIKQVMKHVQKTIDDPRVIVTPYSDAAQQPSPVSNTNSAAYRHIGMAAKQVFGDIYTAPSLMIGASDARHYAEISRDSYRFNPIQITPDDYDMFHGSNERISQENYRRSIQFYHLFWQLTLRNPDQ